MLKKKDLKTPSFPENPTAFTVAKGAWVLKDYPSDSMSLDDHISLTQELVESSDAHVFERNLVKEVYYQSDEDHFSLTLNHSQNKQKQKIKAKRVVFATGGDLEHQIY